MNSRMNVSALALAFAAILPLSPAKAQDVTSGKIVIVSADPVDFVTELNIAGRCGSKYFHVQRAAPNFKEAVAVALTGYTTGSTITFFVASCAGDRNIISHAYIIRN